MPYYEGRRLAGLIVLVLVLVLVLDLATVARQAHEMGIEDEDEKEDEDDYLREQPLIFLFDLVGRRDRIRDGGADDMAKAAANSMHRNGDRSSIGVQFRAGAFVGMVAALLGKENFQNLELAG